MRTPIAFVYGNCVFGEGLDDCWAAFVVSVSSYAWLSDDEKRTRLFALVGALEALEADVQILRDIPSPGRDSMTATYKITGYPESFVIDKSGMIRKKWAAYDDWNSQGNRALIADLLGLPVPTPIAGKIGGDTALRPRSR